MKNKIIHCGYCFEEIEGGVYIDGAKRIYFCSGDCVDKYEKEKNGKSK